MGDEDEPAGQPVPRPRGRRRDADVDRRILDVARAVYAERGWAGFNFDVVAHQARVSKDAIYRRYASKVDLLMAALARPADDDHVPVVADGGIRGFLIAVAGRYFEGYVSGNGLNSLRIYVEAPQNPELLEAYHRERSAPVVTQTRAAIRAAMEAGELPLATSPTAVLDAIVGGVVMHVLRGCGYDFG